MKPNSLKRTEKEKWIENLMIEVFEKARNESNEESVYGITNHISAATDEMKNKITSRNLTRYNDYYLEKKKNAKKRTPNKNNRDVLIKYLDAGYKDFDDYVKKNESKDEKIKRELEDYITFLKKRLIIDGIIITVLIFSLTLFAVKYYKKNCMIWIDDHYEKIRCSGLENEVKLDVETWENLKKINVCDTTTFFKNGKPVVFYLKYKNKLEFFSCYGEHPILKGKFMDPITAHIIETHVKPCNSVE